MLCLVWGLCFIILKDNQTVETTQKEVTYALCIVTQPLKTTTCKFTTTAQITTSSNVTTTSLSETSITCSPITEAIVERSECVTECVEIVEETSIIEEIPIVETSPVEVVNSDGLTYVKHFSRGTYYAYGGARNGGSGRSLIDCSYGDGTVKGSIASSYLYNTYGYNVNDRTKVYLEVEGYSEMNGWYYLDDSDAGNSEVIDFFYYDNSNCQFQYQGVVQVDCYI